LERVWARLCGCGGVPAAAAPPPPPLRFCTPFPHFSLFLSPGVLQVEAMAQLGGIVMMDADSAAAQQNFFFGGIEGCKFRRPVVPGDTLMMHVQLTKFNKRFGIAKMAAKAFIGADLCCEAELTLVMAKGA